jgi:ammonium transporter, Amt family
VVHGLGGWIGNILTGFLGQKSIAALDKSVIPGGWIDHHWIQIGYQLANSLSATLYSFAVTVSDCTNQLTPN